MSDRRLATVASLLGLTLLVYAMVGVRVVYTGNEHYVALVWNVFLAWIPFVLALAVYGGFRRGAGRVPLVVGGALWLLFLPNAPYIVTDLGYLGEWTGAPLWYDVVLASGAAWAGLALGFLSLYLMHAVVRSFFGAISAWAFVLGALALSSFGIYLGRFERWNSWDLFVRPRALLGDIWAGAMNPDEQALAFAVTLLFTAFLAAAYLVFYSFVSASTSFTSSASREARPTR